MKKNLLCALLCVSMAAVTMTGCGSTDQTADTTQEEETDDSASTADKAS